MKPTYSVIGCGQRINDAAACTYALALVSECPITIEAFSTLGSCRMHGLFREDGPLAIFTAPFPARFLTMTMRLSFSLLLGAGALAVSFST
jgi:hypothetical protein